MWDSRAVPSAVWPLASALTHFLLLLSLNSPCNQADSHDPPAVRTLPQQVRPDGVLRDLWAGGQWRVSVPPLKKNLIKNTVCISLAKFTRPVLICVAAISRLQWTTEEGCPVTAPSSCTRYVHVQSFNWFNQLNQLKQNKVAWTERQTCSEPGCFVFCCGAKMKHLVAWHYCLWSLKLWHNYVSRLLFPMKVNSNRKEWKYEEEKNYNSGHYSL